MDPSFYLTAVLPSIVGILALLASVFLEARKAEKVEQKKEKREDEYFKERDLITFLRYSLTQIEEYYVINKNQARNTYWASIIVSFLGFLGLGVSILSWRNDIDNLQIAVPLAGIAGSIVLEFIAYSILNIYRTTLQQLNSYFIQLVRLQELLLSIDLSNKMDTVEVQDSNRKVIIETLLNSYKNPFSITTPDLALKERRYEEIKETSDKSEEV